MVPISYFLDEPVLKHARSKWALIADGRSNPSGSEDQKKWLEVFQLTMSNHEVIWMIHKPIHITSPSNSHY